VAVYRADWVLPVAGDPIPGGWVAIEHGRIAAVSSAPTSGAIDLGSAVILPALVNAHTHLELSYLRDVVPPAARLLDWIAAIIAARRRHADPQDPVILAAARAGIEEARASGTGLVGEISNTLATVPLLREAAMAARVFYELIGFNIDDAGARVRQARAAIDRVEAGGDIRIALAPHAPYSVSPALFSAIRADMDAHLYDVSAVHLGESPEEIEFLADGTGAWRDLLVTLGAWTDAWKAPRASPVQYLADAGFLDSRVLVVHGVQLDGDDLARLRALGATVVSCPRSNRYVGVGNPPLESFYAMGVTVAFGTDSLASVGDLNLFSELALARELAPRVPARTLLESATRCGAAALGFGDEFGTIEVGKRGALIAVQMPAEAGDVEEYLLSGITPEKITWLAP
jgi:cytosine/adenosine deaminase-related metal-dependent hydrolase